jgi:hypothetical protein
MMRIPLEYVPVREVDDEVAFWEDCRQRILKEIGLRDFPGRDQVTKWFREARIKKRTLLEDSLFYEISFLGPHLGFRSVLGFLDGFIIAHAHVPYYRIDWKRRKEMLA